MNVHFYDENLLKQLDDSNLFKIVVGSHMYGLDTKDSDIDYLNIYAESKEITNSFLQIHHQLQYKGDNTDENFVSLQKFIQNTLSGESTINFEVLHSSELKNSELSFLYENRKSFYSYSVIKSYLGMAKRDLGIIKKKYSGKKDSHFVSGVLFAEAIIDGVDIREVWEKNREILLEVKASDNIMQVSMLIRQGEERMNNARAKINSFLNDGKIEKFNQAINRR